MEALLLWNHPEPVMVSPRMLKEKKRGSNLAADVRCFSVPRAAMTMIVNLSTRICERGSPGRKR